MNNRYFVPNKPPETVKSETGQNFLVATLKPTMLANVLELALKRLRNYDAKVLGWTQVEIKDEAGNPKEHSFYPDTDEETVFINRAVFSNNYGFFSRILATVGDDQEMSIERLIDLAIDEPDTVQALYQAAIILNPVLALDYKPGTQTEALNPTTGELKPAEELNPLV